ncbi:MAG: hypothetical protein JST79_20025 [Acidobacteria bacterium]|nr:hypothetical protein [Acidobacteriota bacterium]
MNTSEFVTAPHPVPQKTSPGYYVLLGLVTLFLLLPVLSVHYVPLVDYPNHVARIYILHGYDTVPAYQQDYRVHFLPVPNLAMDLVLPPFAKYLSPPASAKLFLAMIILLFVWGAHALGEAVHGRPSWIAILCAFFVYNSQFLYGYVNYVFGLGVFCLAFACWLRWRASWTPLRLLVLTLLSLASYISHLTSFGFLGVCLVVTTAHDFIQEGKSSRNVALSLLPLSPSILVALFYGRASQGVGPTEWLLSPKLMGWAALLASYDHLLDWILAAMVVVLLLTLGLRTRWKLHRPIFASGVVLFLLFLVLPANYAGTAYVDMRMIPIAFLLCVISLQVETQQRLAQLVFVAMLAIFVVRMADIWIAWKKIDPEIDKQIAAFRMFPENAHVLPVFPTAAMKISKEERALEHVILYSTVYEHTYVPTLFAFWQQPVAFRTPPVKVLNKNALSRYDFVWSYKPTQAALALLQSSCRPLWMNDGFVIWQVQHPAANSGE